VSFGGLELWEAKMSKLRVLFFLVGLVVWATRVDTPVFAQTQKTDKSEPQAEHDRRTRTPLGPEPMVFDQGENIFAPACEAR
jgi:hypothetical protein